MQPLGERPGDDDVVVRVVLVGNVRMVDVAGPQRLVEVHLDSPGSVQAAARDPHRHHIGTVVDLVSHAAAPDRALPF